MMVQKEFLSIINKGLTKLSTEIFQTSFSKKTTTVTIDQIDLISKILLKRLVVLTLAEKAFHFYYPTALVLNDLSLAAYSGFENDKTFDFLFFLQNFSNSHPMPSDELSFLFNTLESLKEQLKLKITTFENGHDFLGWLFEFFLDYKINIKEPHQQIRLIKRRSLKKRRGTFFTPASVVKYITKSTLKAFILDKKTFYPIFCTDIACGSGVFLIELLKTLFSSVPPEKLDYTLLKSIVLSITGVDLSPLAIDLALTNLTLFLALKLPRETLFPLIKEVKLISGNALSPLHYKSESKFSLPMRFEWQKELENVFLRSDGFHISVSNPPYVSFGLRKTQKLSKELQKFFRDHFTTFEYKGSTYGLFIEQNIHLLQEGGLMGYVVPDSFLLGKYFAKLRSFILTNTEILEIVFLQKDFWAAAVGRAVILILRKCTPRKTHKIIIRKCKDLEHLDKGIFQEYHLSQSYYSQTPLNRFLLFFNEKEKSFFERIESASARLADYIDLYSGCIGRYGQKSIITKKRTSNFQIWKNNQLIYSDDQAFEKWKLTLISGSEITPYNIKKPEHWIYIEPNPKKRTIYAKSGFDLQRYAQPKLFLRQTGDQLVAALDQQGLFCLNNMHIATLKRENLELEKMDLFLFVAILNSEVLNKYYTLLSLEQKRSLAQTDIDMLEQLPIPAKNEIKPRLYERVITLVKKLIELKAIEIKNEKKEEIHLIKQKIDQLIANIYP
ncbi:MAG: Eco57I restriction-modification methylase domain-containing protein [Candidatus Hermodarchaeota archaeon]